MKERSFSSNLLGPSHVESRKGGERENERERIWRKDRGGRIPSMKEVRRCSWRKEEVMTIKIETEETRFCLLNII
jgi:hypothetical protein